MHLPVSLLSFSPARCTTICGPWENQRSLTISNHVHQKRKRKPRESLQFGLPHIRNLKKNQGILAISTPVHHNVNQETKSGLRNKPSRISWTTLATSTEAKKVPSPTGSGWRNATGALCLCVDVFSMISIEPDCSVWSLCLPFRLATCWLRLTLPIFPGSPKVQTLFGTFFILHGCMGNTCSFPSFSLSFQQSEVRPSSLGVHLASPLALGARLLPTFVRSPKMLNCPLLFATSSPTRLPLPSVKPAPILSRTAVPEIAVIAPRVATLWPPHTYLPFFPRVSSSKPVTGTCKKLQRHTLALRAHTRITCGETHSVTVALSCVVHPSLCLFHSFVFSVFSCIFIAHGFPFPLSAPSFNLFFPSLSPVLLQMQHKSSGVCFSSSVFCLLVFFFDTIDILTRCHLFLSAFLHLPFLPGYQQILHPLFVLRILAVWI